jgi:hypothetical protein
MLPVFYQLEEKLFLQQINPEIFLKLWGQKCCSQCCSMEQLSASHEIKAVSVTGEAVLVAGRDFL